MNARLGKLDSSEIAPALLHNCVRRRKQDGVSDATINREIAVLKHTLSFAVENALLEENPVEKFRLPRAERTERPRFYNPRTQKPLETVSESLATGAAGSNCTETPVKDLRRHFAIKLVENGASMHAIQQVLGHASVTTTVKHYAQFLPEHSARKILRVFPGGKSSGTKAELSESEQFVEAG